MLAENISFLFFVVLEVVNPSYFDSEDLLGWEDETTALVILESVEIALCPTNENPQRVHYSCFFLVVVVTRHQQIALLPRQSVRFYFDATVTEKV